MMRTCLLAASILFGHADPGAADAVLDNVFLHIFAHEMGHAAIREFDLPVTASEEAMADAFAVVLLDTALPDRVAAIIADRATAHLAEGEETGPFDEYPSDARRAGAILCLAHALDPDGRTEMAEAFGLTGDSAAACRDFGAEIGRGWRRLMAPYRLPAGARVTEVAFRQRAGLRPDGKPSDEATGLAMDMLSAIDWHSRILLTLERCDEGAEWSRNGREIVICDGYLARIAAAARTGGP